MQALQPEHSLSLQGKGNVLSETVPSKPAPRFKYLLHEKGPEYVVEIIVIILGITLSFAVEEWKEQREERQKEQVYLRELLSDIQTDHQQLQEVVAETEQVIGRATRLLALSADTTFVADFNSLAADFRFVIKHPRFIVENATFSDLTSTGHMQLLTQQPFKRLLFDYYRHYESLTLVESAELDALNALAGPYLLKLPLFAVTTPEQQRQWEKARHEPEFSNVLSLRKSMGQELLENYQQALQRAVRLEQVIKQQLY
jgi:hypothetical protein